MAELESELLVLRRLGSDRQHVAEVPTNQIYATEFLGSPHAAVRGPIATKCGAVLRSTHSLVVMREGTKVNCKACVAVSGLAASKENV
jgi:hypothetical protein